MQEEKRLSLALRRLLAHFPAGALHLSPSPSQTSSLAKAICSQAMNVSCPHLPAAFALHCLCQACLLPPWLRLLDHSRLTTKLPSSEKPSLTSSSNLCGQSLSTHSPRATVWFY